MSETSRIYAKNREQWRTWLIENHEKKEEVWLVYYKKHTGKSRVPYDDAVEEALCFGWIDSTVKKIDDAKFCQRFTPRKPNSGWSELNKTRAKKLLRSRKMAAAGRKAIEIAKKNGKWDEPIPPSREPTIPRKFEDALKESPRARDFFDSLAPSYRRHFVGWVASAKREETQKRRISEAISLLENKKKLGMK